MADGPKMTQSQSYQNKIHDILFERLMPILNVKTVLSFDHLVFDKGPFSSYWVK